MNKTNIQYDSVIAECNEIFIKKMKDYGSSWRILRLSSITDQVYIKANRIRTIQETKVNKVGEGIDSEFKAIVNYAIMALIQMEIGVADKGNMEVEEGVKLYNKFAGLAKELMLAKNHDYGEAWRSMRISSLVDLILVKLLRIKQIEDNKGETLISEGIDANYYDILNYAVFSLIKMKEEQ